MKKNLQTHFFIVSKWSVFLSLFFLNSGGLTAQTPANTIFRDDFDRVSLGPFWHEPTSWTILNESAYFFDGPYRNLKTTESYSHASYVIETAAKGFTGSYFREFRITFGQQDLTNSKTYVLTYKPYLGSRLLLGRSTDNLYYPETLDETVLYPHLESDTWYKFKIATYKSGLIQVYVDQGDGYGTVPLLEAIDTTYTGLGHVGWETHTETFAEPFYVDWMEVHQPDIEKPAEREKPIADDLITQVSAKSGRTYSVTKLAEGVKAYTDRGYTVTSVPSYLAGASFIQTAMNDKRSTSDTFLTAFIKGPAIVYIGYDPRGKTIPAWLANWTKTGDRIETTDSGSSYLELYSRLVEYGEIYPDPLLLGGNLAFPAAGAQMNYLVAAVERPALSPLEAEAAFLSGAVIAKNHDGYSGTGFVDYKNPTDDYIEWPVTIDVPGLYTLGFIFANGGASDRTLQINIDDVTLDTLQFISTQSWSSWYFLSGTKVFLSGGVHKIRATAIGTSGPNIDRLSLYYAGPGAASSTLEKTVQRTEIVHQLSEPSGMAHPNPFTQSTKISYRVNEKARVTLVVYAASGQPVQLPVNEIKEPGDYQETINGNRLVAGTYFYRLQIGRQVKVGKLIKQ